MLIAKIENNDIVVADYKVMFPEVSFSVNGPDSEWLAENNCKRVNLWKEHTDQEKLVSSDPYVEGEWVYTVKVEAKTEEEIAADAAAKLQKLKTSIISIVQAKLDSFAKEKGYDGILSACTYATSTNDVFKAEGLKAVELRDASWSALYSILEEVEAGTRTVESFADIEEDLPVLEW